MEPLSIFPTPQPKEISHKNGNGNGHSHTRSHDTTIQHEATRKGLVWERIFGQGHPYDNITWERRAARITKSDGKIVFEQLDVEVPSFWTQTATDIVASKYFRGQLNTPQREWSAKQMIDRVARTIGYWSLEDGYFASSRDAENFVLDLTYILINQYAAFNSPVWFNVGTTDRPQCSACFILSVEDNMQSILEWYRDEGLIFKGGSGSGLNVSGLRSSKEQLSKGGYSSGPVSFMKGADGVANTIKSGGATRRAAKMVVMNVNHPDLKDFIYAKKHIEDMTKVLVQNGFDNNLDGELFTPYTLLPYQNANNSVRVTDDFMRAVEDDEMWDFKAVTTGATLETVKAREVMNWIADAAWHSADPGMQYDTIINRWHTCPNTGPITASNPCSEYMHLDNSACNLASLNLLKFLNQDETFNVDLFRRAVDVLITAQDVIVGRSSYPTPKITQNARDYRELGLGYANLGALLMVSGLPYDSDAGRSLAGQITSLMCGEAYRMSALLADVQGPFAGYATNKEPMLKVIDMHREEAERLYSQSQQLFAKDEPLVEASRQVWQEALALGKKHGVRNSQVTVLAPTGTISFLMDCDTTGIEPDIALVKYKKLVGGGVLKLLNGQVDKALAKLDYKADEIKDIAAYLLEKDTIEGAPHLKPEHVAVFDCSFKPAQGTRSITYMGHLKMMAAAQPFISGAISKTINLPSDATVDDVRDAYMQGWKLGLKAIAIYRDGSKGMQPLNTLKDKAKIDTTATTAAPVPVRIKLPDDRPALTHKFSVGGHEGYLTVGLYPGTKKPGETFLSIAKEGSTVSGLLNTIAILTSMCLQSGVPLKALVSKFKDMSFGPAGFTNSQEIPSAKSIIDYVFRYMGMRFLSAEDREEIFGPMVHVDAIQGPVSASPTDSLLASLASVPVDNGHISSISITEQQTIKVTTNMDAPVCQCGTLMFRAGSCYSCPNCFATTGVCQ